MNCAVVFLAKEKGVNCIYQKDRKAVVVRPKKWQGRYNCVMQYVAKMFVIGRMESLCDW